jgi:DNA repair protein RecO (recombination protein O)
MPIEKTDAIVLRVTPFSATSHVVTWLTRDRGRLFTLVKGATRSRSVFLGQYDLHYTCELLYYGKEQGGVAIAKECAPVKPRTGLRADWRAALCAGYSSELVAWCTMPGQPVPLVYELLDSVLDFLSEHGARRTILPWFELMLLSALGLAPRLDSCSLCGTAVVPEIRTALAPRHGGVLCQTCRARPDAGQVRQISGSAVAMLSAWQRSETPRAAHATACPDDPWLETLGLLAMLLAEHLGGTPPMRTRVVTLLDECVPPTDDREVPS